MKRRDLQKRDLQRRRLLKPTTRPIWAFWHKDLGQARSGQAIIEYTILFAVIAAVTFVGTAVFFQRVCPNMEYQLLLYIY